VLRGAGQQWTVAVHRVRTIDGRRERRVREVAVEGAHGLPNAPARGEPDRVDQDAHRRVVHRPGRPLAEHLAVAHDARALGPLADPAHVRAVLDADRRGSAVLGDRRRRVNRHPRRQLTEAAVPVDAKRPQVGVVDGRGRRRVEGSRRHHRRVHRREADDAVGAVAAAVGVDERGRDSTGRVGRRFKSFEQYRRSRFQMGRVYP